MTEPTWHAYDQYGYAAAAVLGTFAAVAFIYGFLRSHRWGAWARSLQGVAPPFINIVGVLFGLTLAFLANDTWSAHDQAMRSVYREADALHSLAALASTLPAEDQTALRMALATYATASADEWPDLARRAENPVVVQRADALLLLLARPSLEKAVGLNVQAMMLARAAEVRDEHHQRVALSRTHVNPLKWCGMAFLGLLTLLSVAVVHVDKPRAALVSILLFAIAAAPTAAIVLIQGNPFQPPTVVTAEPIRTAVDTIGVAGSR